MKKIITPPDTKLESGLLGLLSTRENYELYATYVDNKRLLPNTQLLLADYMSYWRTYPGHMSINWGIFYTSFAQDWHKHDLDDQDIEYYKNYVFPAVEKAEQSAMDECVAQLSLRSTLDKIQSAIDAGQLDSVPEIIEAHEKENKELKGEALKEEDGDNIFSLDFGVLDKAQGIPHFLPSLQLALGSLTLGQFVVVAADIGTGKSAYVISQLTHTFKHLHKKEDYRPILYFNSEGTSADVMDRFLSNVYHKTVSGGFEEIHARQEEIINKFAASYPEQAQNLWIFPISKIATFKAVKAKIKQYNPALVIIDIVDKLADEEDAQSLKKLYDNLRVLSADMCPIIGTSQAGNQEFFDKDTGQLKNRKMLTDKALYGAKQKGGAADSMIMIGKDDIDKTIRYISVTKNKRGKPCQITCRLLPEYSRYEELDW